MKGLVGTAVAVVMFMVTVITMLVMVMMAVLVVTVLALSMEVVAKTVQLHEISHDICGLFLTK